MEKGGAETGHRPVSVFTLILLLLMAAVILFLVLVQNVDSLSEFFGSTTFKIIFDIALLAGLVLFAVYIFVRNAEYNNRLESMVKRLEKSNTLLQALNEIQAGANASLDAQGLLEVSLEAVMPLTSSLGTVYMLDEETSRLVPRARYGIATPTCDLPDFALGEGVVGKVAGSGEAVEDGGGEKGMGGSSIYRYALPIKAGNRVVGVMVAGKETGRFGDEEKTLLQAVSEVLGNSLTNAKLYDITRRALNMNRKTQGYLESFVREARMGVMVLDEKGIIMTANHRAEKFLGIPLEIMLGHNLVDSSLDLEDRGRRLAHALGECLRCGKGTDFWLPAGEGTANGGGLVSVFPLFGGQKEVIGAAVTISGK